MSGLLPATYSLWRRDVVRFLRQPSRVIGALASPVLFWFVIGSGLGSSFEGGFLQYFFPGSLALIVLFTAIFSTISIIEDRQEGFLQGVLASPAPRVAIVLGKALGSTTLATINGVLFLMLLPLAGLSPGPSAIAATVVVVVKLKPSGRRSKYRSATSRRNARRPLLRSGIDAPVMDSANTRKVSFTSARGHESCVVRPIRAPTIRSKLPGVSTSRGTADAGYVPSASITTIHG